MAALRLDDYQKQAVRSDQSGKAEAGMDLAVLGLVGETGSLLSETKKKQRDSRSYVGYEVSVLEEMGDALWYLATIAHHADLRLSEIVQGGAGEGETVFAQLQPQSALPLDVPTVAFERTLLRLAGAVGRLAEDSSQGRGSAIGGISSRLSQVFDLLVEAANEAGVTLEDAARQNLRKTEDRWPSARILPPLFDEAFPEEERLPRHLSVDIFERTGGNGKQYVVQRCNGVFIGDRLTDNIMAPDDYRFHDAFHYAYAAVLGWSPVTRALFRLKRKSEARVDEGQDGARSILIEEGVATYVFGEAKHLDFFADRGPGQLGFTFLKSVRQFVRGYEVDACPLWLWEEAILAGNQAFRFLRQKRRGRL
ncbi:pyrophosphatase, partial [Methylorubrum thiocyanatum]